MNDRSTPKLLSKSIISGFVKKATHLLGFGIQNDHNESLNEIVYCKNNICVHSKSQTAGNETEHCPGYLNIRYQPDKLLGSTLILTWTPNLALEYNARSLENSPLSLSRGNVARTSRSPRLEYADRRYRDVETSTDHRVKFDARVHSASSNTSVEMRGEQLTAFIDCPQEATQSGSGEMHTGQSSGHRNYSKLLINGTEQPGTKCHPGRIVSAQCKKPVVCGGRSFDSDPPFITPNTSPPANSPSAINTSTTTNTTTTTSTRTRSMPNTDISGGATHSSDQLARGVTDAITAASGRICDQVNLSKLTFSDGPNHRGEGARHENSREVNDPCEIDDDSYDSESRGSTSGPDSSDDLENTCEFDPGFNAAQEEVFDADPATIDNHNVESLSGSVFTVDLGHMKSIHLFSSSDSNTICSGQLVIASHDCQYKVLHFHHGGLDKLNDDIFQHCKFLSQVKPKNCEQIFSCCRQYTVIRPFISADVHASDSDLSALSVVSTATWRCHMNSDGRILDVYQLKKCIFYAGVSSDIRHELWPFLLEYYPYTSTYESRQTIRNELFIEYQRIRKRRENMTDEERRLFIRDIGNIVENDVIRTDRCHPYFKGEHNPNVQVLQNILLNYGFSHSEHGYTQGMSDLLSPILVAVENEVDAYWCFVGLMKKSVFITSPRDIDMDSQLKYLRELIRIKMPDFYALISSLVDGLELLFCHRWILLCFKREFQDTETLRLWESCWTATGTRRFHLFIALAVLYTYPPPSSSSSSTTPTPVALPTPPLLPPPPHSSSLGSDDLLLHFASLCMHMDVELVLSKARHFLYELRNSLTIPCTLRDLFTSPPSTTSPTPSTSSLASTSTTSSLSSTPSPASDNTSKPQFSAHSDRKGHARSCGSSAISVRVHSADWEGRRDPNNLPFDESKVVCAGPSFCYDYDNCRFRTAN